MVFCDEALDLLSDKTLAACQASLEKLMECSSGQVPLVEEEKSRIKAEYITFTVNAEKAIAEYQGEESQKISIKKLWYELLSKEQYYKHCKKFNAFPLLFLNRSFNDTVIEVEVSSLKNISTEKRPLKTKSTEMLNFISTNGPHPLVSMNLVDDFLNAHFRKNWHFIINQSK